MKLDITIRPLIDSSRTEGVYCNYCDKSEPLLWEIIGSDGSVIAVFCTEDLKKFLDGQKKQFDDNGGGEE